MRKLNVRVDGDRPFRGTDTLQRKNEARILGRAGRGGGGGGGSVYSNKFGEAQ